MNLATDEIMKHGFHSAAILKITEEVSGGKTERAQIRRGRKSLSPFVKKTDQIGQVSGIFRNISIMLPETGLQKIAQSAHPPCEFMQVLCVCQTVPGIILLNSFPLVEKL